MFTRNPFPGMNPYLEQSGGWSNVQKQLIVHLAEQLNMIMPTRYVARLGERCKTPGTAPREVYIDIEITRQAGSPVATIEILHPENKRHGEERDKYRSKQQETLNSNTHLIELDLLRAGLPTIAADHSMLPDVRQHDYVICLHRVGQKQQCEIWPRSVRQRLPRIPVPLMENDPDVVLDLQAAVDYCYERGRFAQQIDYAQSLKLALSEEDAEWAYALLREKGLRP